MMMTGKLICAIFSGTMHQTILDKDENTVLQARFFIPSVTVFCTA